MGAGESTGGMPSTGDFNGDGVVDMADVWPFIDVLLEGVRCYAMDINGDRQLDGDDLQEFVEALTGP